MSDNRSTATASATTIAERRRTVWRLWARITKSLLCVLDDAAALIATEQEGPSLDGYDEAAGDDFEGIAEEVAGIAGACNIFADVLRGAAPRSVCRLIENRLDGPMPNGGEKALLNLMTWPPHLRRRYCDSRMAELLVALADGARAAETVAELPGESEIVDGARASASKVEAALREALALMEAVATAEARAEALRTLGAEDEADEALLVAG
jgi:hypothetical protein